MRPQSHPVRAKCKELKKAERRQLRPEGMSLAEASVSSGCRARYQACWRRVCSQAGLSPQATHPAVIVDKALSEVLEDLFDEGEDFSQAQYTTAAVLFYQPALRSPKQTNLPLAKQTLQGWRKLDPPKSPKAGYLPASSRGHATGLRGDRAVHAAMLSWPT